MHGTKNLKFASKDSPMIFFIDSVNLVSTCATVHVLRCADPHMPRATVPFESTPSRVRVVVYFYT